MSKSVFSKDYRVFLREVRAARRRARLTQVQLAEKIGATQSFVSKCERGERRMDVVDLLSFCRAFGVSASSFVRRLEATLKGSR